MMGMILLVLWIGTAFPVQGAEDQDLFPSPKTFNHNRTAFPLTGQHRILPCESCHLGGQYESLSRDCSTCHPLPRNHAVNQSAAVRLGGCPTCHATSGWRFVNFIHPSDLTANQCQKGHDGRKAPGKPSNHIATTSSCDTCHKTTAWSPASFKHDAATGQCSTCHTEEIWERKDFDHRKDTGFALQGAHVKAKCLDCHRKALFSSKTPTLCGVCHRPDDIHSGELGPKCDRCHTVEDFATIRR
ncbi:MAG: cytochrome c3 family protein [Nitrospirae bacterium]|nr:cytochrome c3 family protein [Nitrospirota bacterium]